MKPNQICVRNGIEDMLFMMEVLNISQGNSGTYSHQNQYALDLCGRDAGRDMLYAPAESKVVAIDKKNHAVTWETVNKVRCANGYVGKVTYTTMHDNDFVGIYLGAIYPQGHQIQVEGTGGNATGNHIHMEVAQNPYVKQWEQNPKSTYWRLPNGISADQVFFVDGTELCNNGNPTRSGSGMAWKVTGDIVTSTPQPAPSASDTVLNSIPSDFVYEKGTFKCGVDSIKIRKAPSLNGVDTGLRYKNGDIVNYDGYVKRDGHVWISWISGKDGTRRWMGVREIATNKAFGSFY